MEKSFRKHLSESDLTLLKSLNTPEKVQLYIDTAIKYNSTREDRSVQEVIQDRVAECYNGALFGVACLLLAGFRTSIIRLYARAGDEEHILAVYEKNGFYGSVAQSKFLGLKSRQPIYRSIRDLAVSYVEFYFSYDGRYTLQSYSQLLPISKYNLNWLDQASTVKTMALDLNNSKHSDLVGLNDPFYYAEPERFWKEILVIPDWAEIPAAYLNHKPV